MTSIFKKLKIQKFFSSSPNSKTFEPILKEEGRRNLNELSPNFVPHFGDHLLDAMQIEATQDEKTTPFTTLDLFSTNEMSPAYLRERALMIFDKTENNVNKPNSIRELNHLYKKSVDFLGSTLKRNIPKALMEKEWKNFEEFFAAIENHTKSQKNAIATEGENIDKKTPINNENNNPNGLYSVFFCGILKTMIVEKEIERNSSVIDNLDAQMENLVQKTNELSGVKINTKHKTYSISGPHGKEMTGAFEYNAKSENSIKTKMIYKREYNSLEKFQDLLRMRFVLDSKASEEDYIATVEKVLELYNSKKLPKLKVKWNFLSRESLAKLEQLGVKVDAPEINKGTDLKYRDMKFVGGEINLGSGKWKGKIAPEIQFVLDNNKNEAGFSSHEIYDLKKAISANSRLFGGLSATGLVQLLQKIPTKIDNTSLLNHLFFPQHGKDTPFLYVIEWKRPDGTAKYYFTTSEVYEAKHGKGSNATKTNLTNFLKNYPEPLNRQHIPDTSTYTMLYQSVIEEVQAKIYDIWYPNNQK